MFIYVFFVKTVAHLKENNSNNCLLIAHKKKSEESLLDLWMQESLQSCD